MSEHGLLFEIHDGLPREGPGCRASTWRALRLMNLPDVPLRMLDLGCGPGMQTLDLVSLTRGSVCAIDNHSPFLRRLDLQVRQSNIAHRVQVLKADMSAPVFKPASFDVIWSEGAMYSMGFLEGLSLWRSYLMPDGYMAVTELTWLKENPPAELVTYWSENYPGMRSVEGNIAQIRKAGLLLEQHFTLPEHAWWDDYYTPMEARLSGLAHKYRGNTLAQRELAEHRLEIEMFKKYSAYYGYEFYIMRNV